MSLLENLQGGFHPPCKKGQGDFILVAKNMGGGIISTYTKMTLQANKVKKALKKT